jgi:2-octaprenylphenol hydroxylase
MDAPITISGGGIIGNYISLRLKKNNINSIIVEKSEDSELPPGGIRTLTLNKQSLSMLQNVGIDPETALISKIIVSDGEGTGRIQFSAEDIEEKNLSYVVMFNDLSNMLMKAQKENTIFSNEVQSIQNFHNEIDSKVILKNGISIETKIIAGCDGRNSNVAKIASLPGSFNEYKQTALTFVVSVKEKTNENAYQVFSDKGIFALMPMPNNNNKHTVVWSINDSEIKDTEINDYVNDHLSYFESKLNLNMFIESKILNFKLSNHHLDKYINGSLVLIGDAAHSIHPLAGQGINLGFADADIFCEEVINAYNKGFSINEKALLKRYEIRRRGMNLIMLKSMDFFVNFFNNENLYLRILRNWGLTSINKSRFIKAFFIKHASGLNKI